MYIKFMKYLRPTFLNEWFSYTYVDFVQASEIIVIKCPWEYMTILWENMNNQRKLPHGQDGWINYST